MMPFALGPTFIICTYDLYIVREKKKRNKNYVYDHEWNFWIRQNPIPHPHPYPLFHFLHMSPYVQHTLYTNI
jgi:hypothetical protein